MKNKEKRRIELNDAEMSQVTGGVALYGTGTIVICRDCRKKLKVDVRTHQIIESCPCGHNNYVMFR